MDTHAQTVAGTGAGKVVIAGGSGFLGQSLARELLNRHHDVVILARQQPRTSLIGRFCQWDGRSVGDWAAELADARAIVNLAGRTVDCIKTPDHCDEILRSRVEATLALGEACEQQNAQPATWVQMSTAHIVGDPPSLVCDEFSPPGYGLAPTVGKAWEAAFDEAKPAGTRGVALRTSFVLDKKGGAMTRLANLARIGLGGTIAHGKQGMSWIHRDDMNALFVRAIEDDTMQGVYMATAPSPVSNKVFMKALRKSLGMPIGLPAPAMGIKIAAPLLLRTDPELALCGRYCVSKRLADEGFEFRFPAIQPAFDDLFGKRT